MTRPVSTKFYDTRYCAFCYDMTTNLTENDEDKRVILIIGINVGEDKPGGFGVHGKSDSELIEPTDNRHMVKGICASQKHHTFLISSHIQATIKLILLQNLLKNGLMSLNGKYIIMIMKI